MLKRKLAVENSLSRNTGMPNFWESRVTKNPTGSRKIANQSGFLIAFTD